MTVLVACAGGRQEGAPRPAPRTVTFTTLRPIQVRDTSEHLALIVSRRHVALFPQVFGNVAAIFATAGARVRQGDALLQIDPRKELANLANQLAAKEQRQASLTLANANERRTATLLDDALTTRAQYDHDRGERQIAEQALKAQEAAIDAQRAQVAFYRITAPFEGVVGDIPVKIGDYVTPQSKLTTLDDNERLEAHVSVPAEMIKLLGESSRIELLTPSRAPLLVAPVSFVAQAASPDTQAVLLKASFQNDMGLREGELIPARVVWDIHAGLTIAVSAVLREVAETYVYLVDSDHGAPVARRRAVTLGDIDDGRFVVLAGLKESDRLITSQLQKLHDGDAVELSEQQSTARP
jgi:RND family efflux transporter MFP subunit